MQIRCDLAPLAGLVEWAKNGAARNKALPVLHNLLLRARDGRLEVSATDLTSYVWGELPVEIVLPGEILAPASQLAAMLKESSSEQVSLALEGTQLVVTTSHGAYRLPTLPTDEFPTEPDLSSAPATMRWEAEALDYALETVALTCSVNDGRFNLSSVLLEPMRTDPPAMRLVSSDGHRLTCLERTPPGCADLPASPQVLVPREGLPLLRSLLGKKAGEVAMEAAKGHVAIRNGSRLVLVRLRDAGFPDYRVIIPKASKIKALVGREALARAVRRAATVMDDRYSGVALDFTPGRLNLAANHPDLGAVSEVLEADCQTTIGMGLNHRYLAQACEAFKSEQITLGMNDSRNPLLITGEGDPGLQLVIMPMQI